MEKAVSCGKGAQESGAHLQFCLEPNALLVSCLYIWRLGRNGLYIQFDPVILEAGNPIFAGQSEQNGQSAL